jgi:hypothetical protein
LFVATTLLFLTAASSVVVDANHGSIGDSFRFGFEGGFHHQVSGSIQNRDGDRCLMNIQPNILGIIT